MSEERLIYRGQDVTLDVIMKIESVVTIIARDRQVPFDDAYASFVGTRAYGALQNTETLMWAESAEYIVDRYNEEVPPAQPRQRRRAPEPSAVPEAARTASDTSDTGGAEASDGSRAHGARVLRHGHQSWHRALRRGGSAG